jgi:hypothetical protein
MRLSHCGQVSWLSATTGAHGPFALDSTATASGTVTIDETLPLIFQAYLIVIDKTNQYYGQRWCDSEKACFMHIETTKLGIAEMLSHPPAGTTNGVAGWNGTVRFSTANNAMTGFSFNN